MARVLIHEHFISVQACLFKRIRSVSLRHEGTHLMISDKLAMLFNMTKTEVLLLPDVHR